MTDVAESGLLPLAHLSLDEQRTLREERVRDAFRKARLDVTVQPIVQSPRDIGARARIKLRTDRSGRLGFHRPGTHEWIQVPLEALARKELVEAAARVEAWTGARGSVELRSDGTRVVVVLEQPPAVDADALGGNVALGNRSLLGSTALDVGGLRVSPLSFYQVNLEVNALVVDMVDEELKRLSPAHLLDLYAGVGNLSARAVARGTPATLVEQDHSSTNDARVNCRGATIAVADAGRIKAGQHFFDVAILDPPRAGAPGVIQKLLVTRPRALIYLSCEPSTLARDVVPALASGYRLTRLQPFDMFPGTDHVETLAVVER
jgi:tRNA/tmRNA/rRNA uracil-C5-methylase (TrmA/RlmC/RlmD family)